MVEHQLPKLRVAGSIPVSRSITFRTKLIFRESNGKTEFAHGVHYHQPVYMGGKLFDSLFLHSSYEKTIEKSLENVKQNIESS